MKNAEIFSHSRIKKSIIAILVAVFCFALLTACSSDTDSEETSTDDTATSAEAEEESSTEEDSTVVISLVDDETLSKYYASLE